MAKPFGSPRPTTGSELAGAIVGPWADYARAAGLSVAIGVLLLAPSAFMFEVYGRVLNSRSHQTLAWLLVAAVGIYAVLELLELARSRVLRRAASLVSRKLAVRVFDASFGAGLRRHPGGSGQAPADLKAVTEFVHSPALTGLLDLPAALLVLALLYAMSAWVGALATVFVLVMLGIGLLQERLSSRPFGEAQRASLEAQLRAAGILRNAQVIESMGMGSALHRLWARSQATFMLRLAQASERAGASMAATRMVSVLQGSLLLGLAVWLAVRGELAGGGGMAIVASILGGRVAAPISQVVGQWRQIGAARAAYLRLAELLRTIPADEPGMPLPAPQGLLIADQIVARAPGGEQPILNGVSLGCRAGQLVAVIGPTGCGKSTLARVLVGIWPSEGGKVRLDGADVHAWHKSQLGPYVGYLPQGVELFDGTVAENIARFDTIRPERVRRAIEDAGIEALVASLPQGLETRIGDGGVQLSGGERQRIGLARAVYGEPRLVVLDEPNASLDEAGDLALAALLQRLKARGATVVVITHRTQLLTLAELVLVMKDGRTARFGPRDEVLAGSSASTTPRALPAGGRAGEASAPTEATR
ncbi:MAG: type I secretion system permease/ATPase [Burkholderiales bacterium]|nr:type I secretion system permease/ATPase [Burkholderiales bacterium]